ncbi:hypothetical protein [Acinetobacter pittii]
MINSSVTCFCTCAGTSITCRHIASNIDIN